MLGLEDLRGYQQRLVTRLYEHAVTAAVVPMGGGKTVVALTAIKELIADSHIRSAIVLAPKRVAQLVWPKEVLGWAHLKDLRVRLIIGPSN
jgi:superfamily II DNA or RNA helicase